jgi:hypothetical protein
MLENFSKNQLANIPANHYFTALSGNKRIKLYWNIL